MEKERVKYGTKWEKEMMKFSKQKLITMIRVLLKEKDWAIRSAGLQKPPEETEKIEPVYNPET